MSGRLLNADPTEFTLEPVGDHMQFKPDAGSFRYQDILVTFSIVGTSGSYRKDPGPRIKDGLRGGGNPY